MSRIESDFQKDVIKFLKEQDIWFYRTQMGQQSGLPDIIACVNGMFVGLELKREDGKGRLTLQQAKVLEDINDSGGAAFEVSSMKEVENIILGAFHDGDWAKYG